MTSAKDRNYLSIVLTRAMQADRALSRLPNLAARPKYCPSITQRDFDLHEKYLATMAKEKEQKRIRDAFIAGQFSEIVLEEPIPDWAKEYLRKILGAILEDLSDDVL